MSVTRSTMAVLCVLSLMSRDVHAQSGPVPATRDPGERAPGAFALVQPSRRPPDAPPGPPLALPPEADRVTPLTLEVVVRREPAEGPAQTVRQTVSRTADRVHLATQDGREWLFERNVRDPRRVSGFLVEHAARAVVIHDESDLRNAQGIRGWADVLMLGFEPDLLGTLQPTKRTRTLGGIRFTRYATARDDAPLREAWWNSEQALPGGFVSTAPGGSLRFTVERVRPGADPEVLRPPISRFAGYRAVDLADWLEDR